MEKKAEIHVDVGVFPVLWKGGTLGTCNPPIGLKENEYFDIDAWIQPRFFPNSPLRMFKMVRVVYVQEGIRRLVTDWVQMSTSIQIYETIDARPAGNGTITVEIKNIFDGLDAFVYKNTLCEFIVEAV